MIVFFFGATASLGISAIACTDIAKVGFSTILVNFGFPASCQYVIDPLFLVGNFNCVHMGGSLRFQIWSFFPPGWLMFIVIDSPSFRLWCHLNGNDLRVITQTCCFRDFGSLGRFLVPPSWRWLGRIGCLIDSAGRFAPLRLIISRIWPWNKRDFIERVVRRLKFIRCFRGGQGVERQMFLKPLTCGFR